MYLKIQTGDDREEDFEFLLSRQLSEENRWVIMSKLIPWSEYESEYAQHFSPEIGAPAKSFRMALGALIRGCCIMPEALPDKSCSHFWDPKSVL